MSPGPLFLTEVKFRCQTSRRLLRRFPQLRWTDKAREEWFSLGENHEKTCGFYLNQLRTRRMVTAKVRP
jgi:hypothetical protein